MNFDLSDEQRDIQRLVRDFADAEVRPVAEELDREKRFPYEIVEKLGGLGLMGRGEDKFLDLGKSNIHLGLSLNSTYCSRR